MRICWDNLEKLRYVKRSGYLYKNSAPYIYMDSCKECGESYLTNLYKPSEFCTYKCSTIGDRNNFYGKKHTVESKKKMSEYNGNENNYFWKGGVKKKNIPLYDTYAPQIEWCEYVRRNKDDSNILEVKCAYCGKWFIPKTTNIQSRIGSLNGKGTGENRFYCSTSCKNECPIYKQVLYPKGYKKATSREVQPELRQLVFERDNYTCQKCGSNKSLHCHHIEGIRWEPLESADIDKCITYCKTCHKEVHKIEECGYNDLQCKERA